MRPLQQKSPVRQVATTLLAVERPRAGMPRAAGSPDTWLETQVRSLLREYRAADAVDPETATTVERYLEDGSVEAALRELVGDVGS